MKKYLLLLPVLIAGLVLISQETNAGNWDFTEYEIQMNPYKDEYGQAELIEFVNGGFEQPDLWDHTIKGKENVRFELEHTLQRKEIANVEGYYNYFQQDAVDGWSVECIDPMYINGEWDWYDFIEIQKSNFPQDGYYFDAEEGSQYAELSAHYPGRIYQVCTTKPGLKVYYEYYHRGYKGGKDTMKFYLYGHDGVNKDKAGTLPDKEIQVSISDIPDWKRNFGVYKVPEGQEHTVFLFEHAGSESGLVSAGNFLDAISLSYPSFIEVSQQIDGKRYDEADELYALKDDILTITVTIENNGETPSSRTVMADVLPDGTKYIENSLKLEYQDQEGNTESLDISEPGWVTFDDATDRLEVKIGKKIEDNTVINGFGTGSIKENDSVVLTFDILVTGDNITAGDILKNQILVTYNDLGFEEYNVNASGVLEDEKNVSNIVQVPYLERGQIIINKEITEVSSQEQPFVFKIDYHENSRDVFGQVYYGTLMIDEETTDGTLIFDEMPPGAYTVTELQSSWKYKITDPLQKVQSGSLDGLAVRTLDFDYINKKEEKSWISGSDDIKNNLKEMK